MRGLSGGGETVLRIITRIRQSPWCTVVVSRDAAEQQMRRESANPHCGGYRNNPDIVSVFHLELREGWVSISIPAPPPGLPPSGFRYSWASSGWRADHGPRGCIGCLPGCIWGELWTTCAPSGTLPGTGQSGCTGDPAWWRYGAGGWFGRKCPFFDYSRGTGWDHSEVFRARSRPGAGQLVVDSWRPGGPRDRGPGPRAGR